MGISEEEKNNDMLQSFHREQKKYKEKTKGNLPKKKASREDATLAMLAKFKQKLEKIHDDEDPEEESSKKEDVTKDGDKEDDDDDEIVGDSWMKKSSGLRFEKNDP